LTHVILLAGGSGERFWPWSRRSRPKPFLELLGARPLLADAWSRARRLAPASRVWVVVPKRLTAAVRHVLPGQLRSRTIVEPSPKDTAPAVALACLRIAREDRDARVLVMPSDHAIGDDAIWAADARRALEEAQGGALVCIGVRPDGPRTAFGYLMCATRPRSRPVEISRFVEKPAAARARRMIRTGRCLWNSGTFAWKVGAFLDELGRQRPDIRRAAEGALASRTAAWKRLDGLSVDYAVLEGARRLRAVRLRTAWDDLGSWDVAVRHRARPAAGRSVLVDAPGTATFSRDRFIAVIGVPGAIVVDAEDAVLVVARDRAQEVRRVVRALSALGRSDLL
jgi:mannose-1-phosphate guanylyltransferase/mannose-6-phosphate isomerase